MAYPQRASGVGRRAPQAHGVSRVLRACARGRRQRRRVQQLATNTHAPPLPVLEAQPCLNPASRLRRLLALLLCWCAGAHAGAGMQRPTAAVF